MSEYPHINPAVPTVVKVELDNTHLPENLFVQPDGTVSLRDCVVLTKAEYERMQRKD
jgi:hypothetical protein